MLTCFCSTCPTPAATTPLLQLRGLPSPTLPGHYGNLYVHPLARTMRARNINPCGPPAYRYQLSHWFTACMPADHAIRIKHTTLPAGPPLCHQVRARRSACGTVAEDLPPDSARVAPCSRARAVSVATPSAPVLLSSIPALGECPEHKLRLEKPLASAHRQSAFVIVSRPCLIATPTSGLAKLSQSERWGDWIATGCNRYAPGTPAYDCMHIRRQCSSAAQAHVLASAS